MAEPIENNVNGTPTPSQAPAPAMTFADQNAHVRLNDGTALPIAEVLRMNAETRAQLESQQRAAAERGGADSTLAELIRRDPIAFAEMLQRRHGGAQPHTGGNDPVGEDLNPQPRAPGALTHAQAAELNSRLASLEGRFHKDDLKAQVGAALDRFELFKNNPAARRLAEKVVYAGQVIDENLSPAENARRVYSDVVDALGWKPAGAPTSERDERAARLGAMPHVSANLGSPEVARIAPPTGANGLANKSAFLKNEAAFLDAILGGPQPPTT